MKNLTITGTTVHRLTAPVSSAIAAIAIEGAQAMEVVSAALVSPSGKRIRLDKPCVRFAHWRFTDQQLPDEHVVVLVRTPHSIEIHCHGGLVISDQIMRQLCMAGCDLTLQAPLIAAFPPDNNRDGQPAALEDAVSDVAIQSAALDALQHAVTLKASIVWLEQYQGALAREFNELRTRIEQRRFGDAAELCDALLERARFGMKLLQPWKLTLAGPPNVGKSSLMNALTGASRVLVHHEPGTTRDAVETNLVIGDWPLVLTDTAGIRESEEAIERLGIETAWQRWRTADLGLLVVDATVGWTSQHDQLLSGPAMVMVVLNKIDALGDPREIDRQLASLSNKLKAYETTIIAASTISENGIAAVVEAIGSYLDNCRPPSGSGVPFTAKHVAWLEGCLALSQGR